MTCEQCNEWLGDAVEGTLDAERQAQIDAHCRGLRGMPRAAERFEGDPRGGGDTGPAYPFAGTVAGDRGEEWTPRRGGFAIGGSAGMARAPSGLPLGGRRRAR